MNENATQSHTDKCLADLCIASNHGQIAGVELTLHEWQRQRDCPTQARVLLAACLSRRGKHDEAATILQNAERSRPVTDDAMMMVMVSVFTMLDMPEAASKHLRRLHARSGHKQEVALWIESMKFKGSENLPDQSDAIINQLARELAEQPLLLCSLTAAMKVGPNEQHIQVLRHAGNLMFYRIELTIDLETELCRAMADLAMLAEDEADARRWAHRGLKINPLAAHLAIVLSQVEDRAQLGPAAIDVLAKVNERKPAYPDVHAALIRREYFDGDTQTARMRLSNWLDREPSNPTALKLRKEIAA
ncbi:MAG TPA: hypothetical protein DCM28_16755 [Phycisphaerales bacterium]|mgnify:CR=1 FL=1|nr:hypothetical protein [Phycisphaerales bacterium]HCD31928.1 hypothetical protein [Phycisphaerales bacterium]